MPDAISHDNFRRGDRAAVAIEAWRKEGMQSAPIYDFIADFCHLLARALVDPMQGYEYQSREEQLQDVIERGITHFGADVLEVAQEHDDAWPIDHGEALERANEILTAAGVPEWVRPRAMLYVGLLDPDDLP